MNGLTRITRNLLLAAAALTAGAAVAVYFFKPENPAPRKAVVTISRDRHDLPEAAGGPAGISLYFWDAESGRFAVEEREIDPGTDATQKGMAVVRGLLDGPRTDLTSPFPAGSEVRAFFIADDKTAYVDLNDAFVENHPGGITAELITVYCLVNSLVANLPGVEAVQILIGGDTPSTLAGHVDLTSPFNADMHILR